VSQNCAYRIEKLHEGRDAKTEQRKNGQFRRKVPEKIGTKKAPKQHKTE
jgi:hypothetical protein